MDTLFFHAKVVHIPIALGVLMPLISGAFLVAWWRKWLPIRSWFAVVALQAILLGSGFVALQTGDSEEDRIERVVPQHAIDKHEETAKVFVLASGGVLGLMLLAWALRRSKNGLPAATLATLGTVAVLALGYRTGQAGGELVYRYNAASVYANSNPRTALPGAGASQHPDDDSEDEDDDP